MGEQRPDVGADAGARRVLIASVDITVSRIVQLSLSHTPLVCRSEQSVAATLEVIDHWQPDLLIVYAATEAWLPLVGMQRPGKRLAVIVLTRRGDIQSKLTAFDRGADDFLRIPFDADELVARCAAVMRRAHGVNPPVIEALKIGDLELNLVTRRVRRGDAELHLTSLEQALLYVLAANAGSVLTRDQIVDAVWGAEHVPSSNVVDRHVRALRAKLRATALGAHYIETVHGIGYRFSSGP
ncbi:MAG: hypothetical protein AUH85_06230 [Chloroflexi bacterium 13_1_40CM_4_68_4]|nr:MAG: hypothetical protein AUH85_06230 [Chloroflexi bacterium 13_1_40CM_4_68_4]